MVLRWKRIQMKFLILTHILHYYNLVRITLVGIWHTSSLRLQKVKWYDSQQRYKVIYDLHKIFSISTILDAKMFITKYNLQIKYKMY